MAAEAAMDVIGMIAAAKADGAEYPEEGNLREGALKEGDLREGRMNAAVRKKDILTIIAVVKIMKGKGNAKERDVRFQE